MKVESGGTTWEKNFGLPNATSTMKKLSSLSIFFPVYNDAHTIQKLVKDAYTYGKECALELEVIVVNDGSTDSSREVIKKIQIKHPSLVVVTHPENKGYGAALIAGFKKAKNAWVFYTDADGQYAMHELPGLVGMVTPTTDIVNGFKIVRSDNVLRVIIGSLYNTMLHKLYSLPIADVDCDFRLIKKSCLNRINLQSHSGGICLELILKLKKIGARFAQIGVHHYPRKYGTSQFMTVANLARTLKEHINLFRTSSSTNY